MRFGRKGWAALLVLVASWSSCLAAGPSRQELFQSLHGEEPSQVLDLQGRVSVKVFDQGIEIPESFAGDVLSTLTRLEAVFRPLERPLVIKLGGGSSSMAIAYNPGEDAIVMPGGKQIRNHGLEDRDRLHHEMFHAIVGRTLPHRVTPQALAEPEAVALHEGAADFFASLLDENGVFGENYFLGPTVLRDYRSKLLFPLARGGHARGNALTAYLIEKGFSLAQVAHFFQGPRFEIGELVRVEDHREFGLDPTWCPEVQVRFPALPPSRKGRYRVASGDLLRIRPNQASSQRIRDLGVAFRSDTGQAVRAFDFQPVPAPEGELAFQVLPRGDSGAEKVIVRFLDGEAVVGFEVLYLSVDRER